MASPSRDYHDYVFRDGELVGEFEEMYRHSEEVPWHQDRQDGWVDIRLTVELLADLAPFDEIHDLGCGLGHYLAILHRDVGGPGCRAFGYDISPTAIAQAGAAFPAFTFRTLDLADPGPQPPAAPAGRRLFAIRGTLWYVFPRLTDVVATIDGMMAPGDHLLVVQNFPPLDTPFVGKDVLPDHDAVLRQFGGRFAPVRHLWYEDGGRGVNDNWFIGLFAKEDGHA